jgi:5'-nucleotidase
MENGYPFSFDYPNLHANYITRKRKEWTRKTMSENNKIVFVDVDDVCALLEPVWLGRYNKDYNDNLKDEDLKEWAIEKFVKPECGLKIYTYLKDPGMYDEVVPRKGALEGVNALREMGYRVLFATACPVEVAGRKFHWLREHGFVKKERDYIEIRDKSLLRGGYMIDDSYDNVSGFTGYGYLLTRPWNKKYIWYHRVDSWENFIEIMKTYIGKGM